MSDRPTSREEYTTSGSGSVDRRGDGLDLGGPVGNSGGYGGRPGVKRRGGRGWLWLVLILIVINAASEGVTFADIKQFVSERLQGVDADDIKEGAGSLARTAGENIDLAVNGAEGAESREAVTDFSGTVSDGDGAISVLAGEKTPMQSGGALLDPDHFEWTRNRKLQKVLALTEQEWENVDTIKLNVFVDDGGGFIDLGLDPLFKFDDYGNLLAKYDGTWLSIDKQPVAFYHLKTVDYDDGGYTITGYVPAFLNDKHVNLILIFDTDHPQGYIKGAKAIEEGPGTGLSFEEMTSGLVPVRVGDRVDYVCDYYNYYGEFVNNYFFGYPMTMSEDPEISNIKVKGRKSACYMITDRNGYRYWTPLID